MISVKSSKEEVLEEIKRNGFAFFYASETIQNDREVVIAQLQAGGILPAAIWEKLRNDEEIVRAAVQQNGLALQHASEKLRSDEEIVRAAIQQNGLALQHASERLRNDKDIVRAAIQQNGLALQYAPKALQDYPDFALEAVKQNAESLSYLSVKFDTSFFWQLMLVSPQQNKNLLTQYICLFIVAEIVKLLLYIGIATLGALIISSSINAVLFPHLSLLSLDFQLIGMLVGGFWKYLGISLGISLTASAVLATGSMVISHAKGCFNFFNSKELDNHSSNSNNEVPHLEQSLH